MKKLLVLVLLLLPMTVFAHNKGAAGFISGFAHPLFGLDHLLAMLGVGLISARIEGHFIWSIPALFVTCMVIGGVLGSNGIMLPLVEIGIAVSVLVLGIANIFVKKANLIQVSAIMLFVGVFGTLHGHAHGVEMPDSISPAFYTIGFMLSTTTIHILGVYIGFVPSKYKKFGKLPSYVGSTMAFAGCIFIYNLT